MSIVNTKLLTSFVVVAFVLTTAFPVVDTQATNVKDMFKCAVPTQMTERNLLYTGNDAAPMELPNMTADNKNTITVVPILFSVCNADEKERNKKTL